MTKLTGVLIAIGAVLLGEADAQRSPQNVAAWNDLRLDRRQQAMTSLTSWGAVNTVAGLAIGITADGEELRQAGYMTAGWGAINAALGVFGLRGVRKERTRDVSLAEGVKTLHKTERILLFNAGLDLGYVAAGAYLTERSRRADEDNPARLRGYGKAIIVQGIGLFVFDLLAYRHLHQSAVDVTPVLTSEGAGIGATMTF